MDLFLIFITHQCATVAGGKQMMWCFMGKKDDKKTKHMSFGSAQRSEKT